MFTSNPFEESHKVSFRLTLIFIIFFLSIFLKAFHTLLLWNRVCKSLTSQEHIFNNSQSLSTSTMLCSQSLHNIKQTGSHINKYENCISEDGGQHYVKQIEDVLGKSENGERVSWRFQLIFAAMAQPQLIRWQKRAIQVLRGPLWQHTHNDIAALGPFSVTEFNLVSSHNVYYVCALNMIFSIS